MSKRDPNFKPPWAKGKRLTTCEACGKDLAPAIELVGVDVAFALHTQAHLRQEQELLASVLQRANTVAKRMDMPKLERDTEHLLAIFGGTQK